jgi:tetratricopeptide (TPR) repeat protein
MTILLFLGFRASAQTAGNVSALENYQKGREFESRSGLSAAEPYYIEAIRICQDEVSRKTAGRETYTVITWALRRLNRHTDVISWGERGLGLYADDFRVIETMGESFFYLGNYPRSLLFMQRYVNAIPQGDRSAIAYFFIGEIYRLTRMFLHADIAYTTAVHLDQGNSLWWYRLGSVREAASDREPAIAAYQQALKLNPNYREANEGLARMQR